MAVYPSDVAFVKGSLWSGENVIATATERRFGPGMSLLNPTTMVITDRRVLIVNRNLMGLRKDIETIPFNMIASVRLENGIISSSVYLRVGGYSSPGEQGFLKKGEQEGQLSGLHKSDAKAISDYLEKVITEGTRLEGAEAEDEGRDSLPRAQQTDGYITCPKCRGRNPPDAAFCETCGTRLQRK